MRTFDVCAAQNSQTDSFRLGSENPATGRVHVRRFMQVLPHLKDMSRVSRGGHAEEEPGPEADALLDEAQASPVNSEGEILRTVDLHTWQRLPEVRDVLRVHL